MIAGPAVGYGRRDMPWPVDEFTMTCPDTGVEHLVSVALPVRHRSLERVPLLLCLDGPWTFGTVTDATRIMSMGGEAPEAAVVGLSFRDPSMGEYLRQRARWYTPTPWVPPEVTGVKGVFDVVVDGRTLYSKHETGRHAEPHEVLTLFREQYAADVTPYER